MRPYKEILYNILLNFLSMFQCKKKGYFVCFLLGYSPHQIFLKINSGHVRKRVDKIH